MSENENVGAAIPRFSEMFPFADDPDLNEHVRELRAEAWAYGFGLDIRIFPGSIPPPTKAELSADIPPLPKRAREILHELLTKHYLNEGEAVNAERRRRGQLLRTLQNNQVSIRRGRLVTNRPNCYESGNRYAEQRL
jgi:hypothetical protein